MMTLFLENPHPNDLCICSSNNSRRYFSCRSVRFIHLVGLKFGQPLLYSRSHNLTWLRTRWQVLRIIIAATSGLYMPVREATGTGKRGGQDLIQLLSLIMKKTNIDRHCGYSLITKTQLEKHYSRIHSSITASIST